MLAPTEANAQGWPANFKGVMLQGFYWNSYSDTNWSVLEKQADELSEYFKLIWIPQSGYCGGQSMGYNDLYWFNNYNSSFGTEAELRSMIKTFKAKGLGTIADVVINHRGTLTNWVDFPVETYNGQTYKMESTDICADDDGGECKAWADKKGYKLSSNNDTGEGWGGMRDLDHNSSNVQTIVKAYLNFLLNDLGYAGFRYDMVKGYDGKFTGIYNNAAKPTYSVGEYWDGNANTVKNWMNKTKVGNSIMSGAFDFTFRYSCRDAANGQNWSKLANGGINTDNAYKRYAVTFVENHDVEYRSESEPQDPIKRDTVAVNAFMLAMPGTPCVFLKHWQDCKNDIKNMILLRNLVGISNTSSWTKKNANGNIYVVETTGDNGKLLAAVGKLANKYAAPAGTEPTATNGKKVSNGAIVKIPEGNITFKVGLLSNGKVTGVQTRSYNHAKFNAYDIKVYVNLDKVGWTKINRWSWGGDGSHNSVKAWPGDQMTTTTTIAGKKWYEYATSINTATDEVSFVFSTGTGDPQTVDVPQVKHTTYLEVQNEKSGDKYMVKDVTEQITSGVNAIVADNAAATAPTHVVALDGRTVRTFSKHVSTEEATLALPAGLYIVNGKKVVVE